MNIFIAKGRIFNIIKKKIVSRGLINKDIDRKIIINTIIYSIKIIPIKVYDILYYIKNNINDIAIIGKDIYMEESYDSSIYKYIDLYDFRCRLSIISRKSNSDSNIIATKYINILKNKIPKYKNIIYLHGTLEVGLLLEKFNNIFDIVCSGKTILKNNLYEKKIIINNINPILIFNKKTKKLKKVIILIKYFLI